MFKVILVVALCAAVYCAPADQAQNELTVEEIRAPEDKALDSSIPAIPADNKEALEGAESAFITYGSYPLIGGYHYPYYYPGPIAYNAHRHVYLYK